MDTLLAESDYVSLHMNLTPENHHFMNDDAFDKMKETAIVVNAARGPAIDPRALYTVHLRRARSARPRSTSQTPSRYHWTTRC